MPSPPPMSTWRSLTPAFARSWTSATSRAIASVNGAVFVSCEPMWQSTPTTSSPARFAASRNSAGASAIPTPNLFCLSPVEMYGWVCGSTSGLTRNEIRARLFESRAMPSSTSSSSALSTLKHPMFASSAAFISDSVLPTPENTTCSALPPARTQRYSSPTETMSAPAPSWTSTPRMPSVEFALTA